jgi:hypothetical protein
MSAHFGSPLRRIGCHLDLCLLVFIICYTLMLVTYARTLNLSIRNRKFDTEVHLDLGLRSKTEYTSIILTPIAPGHILACLAFPKSSNAATPSSSQRATGKQNPTFEMRGTTTRFHADKEPRAWNLFTGCHPDIAKLQESEVQMMIRDIFGLQESASASVTNCLSLHRFPLLTSLSQDNPTSASRANGNWETKPNQ